MNKKSKWLIALAVSGLLIMAIAIPALAAGPNATNSTTPTPNVQPGSGNGQGFRFGPDEVITKLLGMTQEQIQEQREAGKSLVQIAASKNVSEEALINAIMAEKQAALKNMVAAGTITQAQFDQRIAQMKERTKLAVNRTTIGPPEWAGNNGNGKKGGGMMGQGSLKGNQQSCTGIPGTCTGAGKMLGRTTK